MRRFALIAAVRRRRRRSRATASCSPRSATASWRGPSGRAPARRGAAPNRQRRRAHTPSLYRLRCTRCAARASVRRASSGRGRVGTASRSATARWHLWRPGALRRRDAGSAVTPPSSTRSATRCRRPGPTRWVLGPARGARGRRQHVLAAALHGGLARRLRVVERRLRRRLRRGHLRGQARRHGASSGWDDPSIVEDIDDCRAACSAWT